MARRRNRLRLAEASLSGALARAYGLEWRRGLTDQDRAAALTDAATTIAELEERVRRLGGDPTLTRYRADARRAEMIAIARQHRFSRLTGRSRSY